MALWAKKKERKKTKVSKGLKVKESAVWYDSSGQRKSKFTQVLYLSRVFEEGTLLE